MEIILLSFILVLSNIWASAQYPKHIIQLKDKNRPVFYLSEPAKFLSQRAIDRRARYNIAIDSADLPVTTAYLDSIKTSGNVRILSTSKWLNQVLIESTDENAIDRITAFPFVLSARGIGNRVIANITKDKPKEKPLAKINNNRQSGSTADTYNYGANYNQVHIHEGEFLHNKGYGGETMLIAVLDAGFFEYKTITAFDSVRINGQVKGERDFVAFDNSVNEDDAHGMHCLSTMSANWPGKMTGTAPKANYWLLRTENSASEYPIEEHNWAAGAEFADSVGCDLISSSLGYFAFNDPSFNHSYTDIYKNQTRVTRAASIAVKKGLIVTNSAGNEGNNSWKYLSFPADADSVCAVGAVNASGTIAGFSSFGYPGKVKPNIVSVGQGTVIAGTNNQPVTGNGTSFSNPNVAGLIACLWQAFPAVNNMKILDAVYKSSDRYNNPDNRFGYGIPNFRKAYQILKHEENITKYGTEWLLATPNPFTNKIAAQFIAQTDGTATLQLLNAAGQVLASNTITVEKEELYTYSFTGLENLPHGSYTLMYTDVATSRSIVVRKASDNWLTAVPNPFTNNIIANLRAPETGEIYLRLLDAKGSLAESITLQVTENENYTIHFTNVTRLQTGVYFLQYISKSQTLAIRLLKG